MLLIYILIQFIIFIYLTHVLLTVIFLPILNFFFQYIISSSKRFKIQLLIPQLNMEDSILLLITIFLLFKRVESVFLVVFNVLIFL